MLIDIFQGVFSNVMDLQQAPAVYSLQLYDTTASNMWSKLCQQTKGLSHSGFGHLATVMAKNVPPMRLLTWLEHKQHLVRF